MDTATERSQSLLKPVDLVGDKLTRCEKFWTDYCRQRGGNFPKFSTDHNYNYISEASALLNYTMKNLYPDKESEITTDTMTTIFINILKIKYPELEFSKLSGASLDNLPSPVSIDDLSEIVFETLTLASALAEFKGNVPPTDAVYQLNTMSEYFVKGVDFNWSALAQAYAFSDNLRRLIPADLLISKGEVNLIPTEKDQRELPEPPFGQYEYSISFKVEPEDEFYNEGLFRLRMTAHLTQKNGYHKIDMSISDVRFHQSAKSRAEIGAVQRAPVEKGSVVTDYKKLGDQCPPYYRRLVRLGNLIRNQIEKRFDGICPEDISLLTAVTLLQTCGTSEIWLPKGSTQQSLSKHASDASDPTNPSVSYDRLASRYGFDREYKGFRVLENPAARYGNSVFIQGFNNFPPPVRSLLPTIHENIRRQILNNQL